MNIIKNKKIFFPLLAFIVTLSAILSSPITIAKEEQKGISNETAKIIQNSLKYDTQNKKYIFDENNAIKNGLNKDQAINLKTFFESMNDEQIQQFNKDFGFKPDFNTNQIQLEIAPALLAVLAFIGGAAAGKLLDEVMNYGIAKTCKANKGKWAAFDDYCKTNGHA